MALTRLAPDFDPVGGLLALQSELERFLRNPGFSLGLSGFGAYPPINIFDHGNEVVAIAEVPGLDLTEVQVSGQGRTLTLSSERRPVVESDGAYHRRERKFTPFSRSIQMPDELDLSKASATYNAGLLIVRIPKSEAAKPRQIKVQSA